jgi:hypothetical protein
VTLICQILDGVVYTWCDFTGDDLTTRVGGKIVINIFNGILTKVLKTKNFKTHITYLTILKTLVAIW